MFNFDPARFLNIQTGAHDAARPGNLHEIQKVLVVNHQFYSNDM